MKSCLSRKLFCMLAAAGMASAALPLTAGNMTAEGVQRLVFTPQNDANLSPISANEELILRVDGLDLRNKLSEGVDISTCKISHFNPGENVIATAEITDAENGVIRVQAGPATGSARLHLKCRNKQVSVVIRVS